MTPDSEIVTRKFAALVAAPAVCTENLIRVDAQRVAEMPRPARGFPRGSVVVQGSMLDSLDQL
jgi:hypothetical protein